MNHSFEHQMGDRVSIAASGESGEIVAAATYAHTEDHYLIRYRAGDGRAVEAWWGASAIEAE